MFFSFEPLHLTWKMSQVKLLEEAEHASPRNVIIEFPYSDGDIVSDNDNDSKCNE